MITGKVRPVTLIAQSNGGTRINHEFPPWGLLQIPALA